MYYHNFNKIVRSNPCNTVFELNINTIHTFYIICTFYSIYVTSPARDTVLSVNAYIVIKRNNLYVITDLNKMAVHLLYPLFQKHSCLHLRVSLKTVMQQMFSKFMLN